ncbi:MAG TPA: PLDc N-terminal domain-containing protein [Caulobacteraceae bacterium]
MPFLGGGLSISLLISIALCVHVVRTNQQIFWIFVILFVPVLGSLVYIVAVIVPEMVGGTRAKRMGMAARDALDPTREYRMAKNAVADTGTVHNQMRLAAAAAALGRHGEAEQLYAEAAHGIHADDPALLLGRANALIELGRQPEALPLLDKLADEQATRSPTTALAQARVYEALGRYKEADGAYQWAAGRLPGLEALARYAVFLAGSGRREEAADHLAEIDRRIERSNAQFRRESRPWRDLAAQALARA